jgi:hypothetical protein
MKNNDKMEALKAAKAAQAEAGHRVEAVREMSMLGVSMLTAIIESEERMHAASLSANTDLLSSALKGAETVDAEQFGVLITTLKEVSLAGIEAQRALGLEHAANGRQGLKMMEAVATAAIEAGVPAFASVGLAHAEARQTAADAQLSNAQTRVEELEVKKQNSRTESRKAYGAYGATSVEEEEEAEAPNGSY